jgi:hypothetical protein
MKYNRYPKIRQADRRFYRPVGIHVASARAIERIARKHGISAPYAAVVADLTGIGGKAVQ